MTALDLFTRLCHLLTRAGIPYQDPCSYLAATLTPSARKACDHD